jgi:hypothetical protein
MVIDERSCTRCGSRVDWCPTACLPLDHFRLTPADARESVDLAIVPDGGDHFRLQWGSDTRCGIRKCIGKTGRVIGTTEIRRS